MRMPKLSTHSSCATRCSTRSSAVCAIAQCNWIVLRMSIQGDVCDSRYRRYNDVSATITAQRGAIRGTVCQVEGDSNGGVRSQRAPGIIPNLLRSVLMLAADKRTSFLRVAAVREHDPSAKVK